MKIKTKAILTLMVLPPLFAELLSGHTPAPIFFQPLMLILMLIGYSLPALIVRELSIRWRLGLWGIFMLGLAFGIFNEGIGAKTFLLSENIPASSFAHNYGCFFGINFTWAANVMIYQALISILLPILFIHYIYPDVKKRHGSV